MRNTWNWMPFSEAGGLDQSLPIERKCVLVSIAGVSLDSVSPSAGAAPRVGQEQPAPEDRISPFAARRIS